MSIHKTLALESSITKYRMARVMYVKKHSDWISRHEEDLQVLMLKSIWCEEVEDQGPKGRIIFDKTTLNIFETYYTMQSNHVDSESLDVLKNQTDVTKKQIKQWFANRRSRAAKLRH